jgi:hypothetical protein
MKAELKVMIFMTGGADSLSGEGRLPPSPPDLPINPRKGGTSRLVLVVAQHSVQHLRGALDGLDLTVDSGHAAIVSRVARARGLRRRIAHE